MEIKPSGSVPTRRQPKESFTGVAWQDPTRPVFVTLMDLGGQVEFQCDRGRQHTVCYGDPVVAKEPEPARAPQIAMPPAPPMPTVD